MDARPVIYILDELKVMDSLALALANDLKAEVKLVHTAGQFLEACRAKKPNVIIAELKVPYGSAAQELHGAADELLLYPTLRALTKLSEEGLLDGVCVYATYNGEAFSVTRLARLVAEGKIRAILEKPFDAMDFVMSLCLELGLPNPYDWTP